MNGEIAMGNEFDLMLNEKRVGNQSAGFHLNSAIHMLPIIPLRALHSSLHALCII